MFTNLAKHSEVLSKISSAINSSLLLTVCQRSRSTTGNSAILNQLEAGLIMVRAIKSICKLSLPLSVYGPMRSTHKHSHGFVMTVFGGRCPYFHDRLLLIWQDLHDFVSDRMVVRIPFQYMAAFILLKTCMSRVLQIVMIPLNCTQLEWLGGNQPTIFAYTCNP